MSDPVIHIRTATLQAQEAQLLHTMRAIYALAGFKQMDRTIQLMREVVAKENPIISEGYIR